MQAAFRTKLAGIVTIAVAGCCCARAQAPGVPICDQAHQEPQITTSLLKAAKELFAKGDGLKPAQARQQLKRTACQLALPEAGTRRLSAREICIAARQSHLRVGWSYLCPKCGNWHLNLAGGYALTTNGAVATCFHVVEPGRGRARRLPGGSGRAGNRLPGRGGAGRPTGRAMPALSGSPATASNHCRSTPTSIPATQLTVTATRSSIGITSAPAL